MYVIERHQSAQIVLQNKHMLKRAQMIKDLSDFIARTHKHVTHQVH